MLDFSINSSVSAVSNSIKQLAPFAIHDVKYEKSEIVEINGKKDPSQHYKILNVRFSNADGYYEERLFFPTPANAERRKFENPDGTTREVPSNWERTKFFMAQTMEVLNPEGYKKFCEASSKFKDFEMMANAFIKVLEPVVGKETKLKLMGRTDTNGNVHAVLPNFLNINKDGQLYISTNFIGDRVFFSTYEEGQVQKFKNAKPTAMPDLAADPLAITSKTEEAKKDDVIDLDSLLS